MDKLYDTGLDRVYENDALNRIFDTKDLKFLQSNDVKVMKRTFNAIPSDKMPPFRALTDPKVAPIVEYRNVGVVSDFPKTLPSDIKHTLWKDGTYDDMKKMAAKQTDEYNKELKFAPDTDFDMRFQRLEREKSVQFNIANYFSEKQQEKELERRILLSEYGLNPDEVERVIAEKRVADAVKMLDQPRKSLVDPTKRLDAILRAVADQRKPQGAGDMDARPTERTQAREAQQSGTTVRGRRSTVRPPRTVAATAQPMVSIQEQQTARLQEPAPLPVTNAFDSFTDAQARAALTALGATPNKAVKGADLKNRLKDLVGGKAPADLTEAQITELANRKGGGTEIKRQLTLFGIPFKANNTVAELREALASQIRRR